VIILNYNVCHFLELCLKSVTASISDISAEIIVVDNASKDESCKMVKTKFPSVHLIENKNNIGFSKGNNIGVKQAVGEFICILNPDTVVAEDTFDILLQFAQNQKKLGIIGCKLIDGQGIFLPESKRHIPTPWVSTKKMLGFKNSYYANEIGENIIDNVEILVGAFMLVKKVVYEEVGGFDEDYFMYGEDVDLSYKILKLGYNNVYNGKAAIIHFKGESTLKDSKYIKQFYGAMQIFYQKHFKSYRFFNFVVWVWVRVATLFLKLNHVSKNNHKQYVLVSDRKLENLKKSLNHQIMTGLKVSNYLDDTEYILDSAYLRYKDIITIMDNKPKNCNATFKIIPKNSKFILGSDDSKSQGQVIRF